MHGACWLWAPPPSSSSATLLASLPSLPPAPTEEAPRASFLGDAGAGLGYIWSVPVVRTVRLGFFAVVAFNGIDDVALVFLARDVLLISA